MVLRPIVVMFSPFDEGCDNRQATEKGYRARRSVPAPSPFR
jgi:hypothetical protein